jgi:hypothetical protein
MRATLSLRACHFESPYLLPPRPRNICLRCLLRQRRTYATERYVHHWKEEAKNPDEESSRRRFESWMNGPGAAFRKPLPGSTNYLNAYNKQGALIRQAISVKEDAAKKSKQVNAENAEELELTEQEKARREERDRELQRAAAESQASQATNQKLPPETAEDLRPFPLNRNFVSERVLSEELREMLYVNVEERGRTIRQVSADFKVSIERVAAVVRMKQMERDWLAKVRSSLSSFTLLTINDDFNSKNRLVLKTTPWLQNNALRASLT